MEHETNAQNSGEMARNCAELFQNVTKAVASAYSLESVLDLIVHKLAQTLQVDAATVRLLDKKTSKLVLKSACGLSERYLARGPLDSEKSVGEVLRGHPVAIYDVTSDPRMQYQKEAEEEGIKSLLGVPIVVRDTVYGVLRLLTRQHREFSEDETGFVVSLAEYCGIAIEHAIRWDQNREHVARLETLHEMSRIVNTTLDINVAADLIVSKLPKIMNVQAVTIRLLDEQTGRLKLVAAAGLSDKYLERGTLDAEASVKLVLEGTPVAIKDAATDPRIQYGEEAKQEGIKSILAVPITAKGQVLGVLRLLTTTPRDFSEEDIEFVTALAEQSGLTIRNALHHNELTRMFQSIQNERGFLQEIIDSLEVFLLAVDLDNRVILVNKKYVEARGVSKEAVLGVKYDVLEPQGTVGLHTQIAKNPLDTVKKTGQPFRFERLWEDAAGNVSRLEAVIAPVRNPEGIVEAFVQVMSDVTLRKRQEQMALEAEKLKGVLEMAATLAHELNNPVFSALGTAQLIRRELPNDDGIGKQLDIVEQNLKAIRDLTRRMTQLSVYRTRSYVDGLSLIDIRE